MRITLPEPASLTIRYDIPGDLPESKVELDYLVDGVLEPRSWNVFESISNQASITLTNLPPGTYHFIRMKELSVGDMDLGKPIEQTRIDLEGGQHKTIELVRTTGFPVRGSVIGLTNTEAAGALLYVQSSETTNVPWAPTVIMQRTFDALTCDKDGKFQTALLEPGTYTITAEAYKPEVPEYEDAGGKRIRVFRSGLRRPDYVGSANVTVTADHAPEPVKIELLPRTVGTNQPSARPETGRGEPSSSDPQSSQDPDTNGLHVVTSKVIDVETRQPIPEFTVTPGNTGMAADLLGWMPEEAVKGTNGIFHITYKPYRGTLKLESPGYLPELVHARRLLTNGIIELHRGEFVTGRVLGVDGRPVAGAQVALHLAYSMVEFRQTNAPFNPTNLDPYPLMVSNTYGGPIPITTTDTRGEFKLPVGAGMDALIASSAEGFACVKLGHYETSKIIQLEPWAKVLGTVRNGDQAIAGKWVQLIARDHPNGKGVFPAWSLGVSVITDAQGHFLYDRMPPGELNFSWLSDRFQERTIKVEAGKTITIDLDTAKTNVTTRVEASSTRTPTNAPSPNSESFSRDPAQTNSQVSATAKATPNTISYAAGFVPEKSEIMLGEPIYLEFNLTNTGNRAILLPVGGQQWTLPGPYRIQVFDANGAHVTDQYQKERLNHVGGGVMGVTAIEPGQTFVDRLYLPTFIQFKQPGDYTIVATRRMGFYDEPASPGNHPSHGAINDELYWVNTVDHDERFFEKTSGAIENEYRITNQFKLTVLPANKERLLTRARELAAKLDVIGAEDLRMNPNPPRPLDLKADWSAMTSAYWLGRNNQDLRWVVKEISDIGDRRIIPELKQGLANPNMRIRFACVKMLCALGEPLQPDWIVPVIKSERWNVSDDPEMFAKDHGGTNAASILIACMNLSDPSVTNLWNYRLVNTIRAIGNPGLNLPYFHDDNLEGTPQQIRENATTLQKLQEWLKAHPIVQVQKI